MHRQSEARQTNRAVQVESESYRQIALNIGADDPGAILFATDNIKEAEAAQEAGWQVALTVRPGNAPLPKNARSRFRVIDSLAQLVAQQ